MPSGWQLALGLYVEKQRGGDVVGKFPLRISTKIDNKVYIRKRCGTYLPYCIKNVTPHLNLKAKPEYIRITKALQPWRKISTPPDLFIGGTPITEEGDSRR